MPTNRPYRYNAALRKSRKTRAKNMKRKRLTVNQKAKRVALSLRETKIKDIASTSGVNTWDNANKWLAFQPLNLDLSGNNDESNRENSMIYAMNYRLKLLVEPHPESTDPFYLRVVMGYAKGSNNYGESSGLQIPSNMVQSSNLNVVLPNHFSDFDKDDWKILQDKVMRIHPRQIYDSSSGVSPGESSGLTNDNRALWGSIRKTFNFKFNRKYRFEGVTGGSLVGWYPFCAIQLDRTPFGAAFTGNAGNTPSPLVTYESQLYFKEIP